MKERSILRTLFLWRLINALSIRSFFQADEYWQSLEPAHVKAFGYGDLTWEWQYGLRSYAFPVIFEMAYYAARLLGMAARILLQGLVHAVAVGGALVRDGAANAATVQRLEGMPGSAQELVEYYGVLYGPRIVMAAVAAYGEYYSVLLVRKLYLKVVDKRDDKKGDAAPIGRLALMLTMTNFFNYFFATRTFINSFEMTLTAVALYHWDWTGGHNVGSVEFTTSLAVAIFACLQRPTNALIWAVLGGFLVLNLVRARQWRQLWRLSGKVFAVTTMAICANVAIDYYFYGGVLLPLLRFIEFNFTTPLADFYGRAPWHFHLLQSMPLILGYTLPFFVSSLLDYNLERGNGGLLGNPLVQLKCVVVLNIAVFSFIRHKEFRFLYPLQPLFLSLSALEMHAWLQRHHARGTAWLKRFQSLLYVLPVLSVTAALIINTVHEAGVVSVMDYLHFVPNAESIGFIMPCHSTPWQSHLHRNDIGELWEISCDPPLSLMHEKDAGEQLLTYMDESDHLYENISEFIHKNFPPVFRRDLRSPGRQYSYEWPEYLVVFEHMEKAFMKEYLKDSNYVEVKRFFNSLSHWDSRRSGDVIVYHKSPWY
ncbi:AaceriADL281Cp [[Ashbya] aceris (nom. inval.)]|nr:AaceriADL281Cp [[Ashbya] aceris (nom. inval.)]